MVYDLQNTDLQKTDLQKTDLQKTDLHKTDLQKTGSVPMKVFRIAAAIALLMGSSCLSAYAQMPNMNLIPETISKTPEEKEAEAERDKAYRDSLKKIPDAKVSADPWGAVRSPDAPKATTPKVSASSKPKTKTGSAAN
jgi:hypothetical protein